MRAVAGGPSVPAGTSPSLGAREGAPPRPGGQRASPSMAPGRVCAVGATAEGAPGSSGVVGPSGGSGKVVGAPSLPSGTEAPSQAATSAAGGLAPGSSSKAGTSVDRCSRMGGTTTLAKSSVSPEAATGAGLPPRSLTPESSGSAACGGTVATGTSANGGGASRSSSTAKDVAAVVASGGKRSIHGSSAPVVGSPVAGGDP